MGGPDVIIDGNGRNIGAEIAQGQATVVAARAVT